jgi:peptidoglycan/LPS O-acetylase OafA/YrhL
MASDWGVAQNLSFDGPIWSVSVEVLVYLLFFVMLRLTQSAWLNVVVVAACLDAAFRGVGWQVVYCLAFFYIGGLAAMARRAVSGSRYRKMIEAGAWLAVAVIPPAVIHAAGDQLDHISLPLFGHYAASAVLPVAQDRRAGLDAGDDRRGRQYDLFKLSLALSDPARDRALLYGRGPAHSRL